MRADICDANDALSVAKFKTVLRELGAELVEQHQSALGVDLWQFRCADGNLTVFSDAWFIDIEGPPALVRQITTAMSTRTM
jgi:hypothetical protein